MATDYNDPAALLLEGARSRLAHRLRRLSYRAHDFDREAIDDMHAKLDAFRSEQHVRLTAERSEA
ncbi:hypothetical protein [Isoptericola sp. G70]|uniref:hypothetical protein n=1 Tax=Isoptericola sp. G70 TaxID=3376633 RepID=UPI003A811B3E